MRPNDEPGSTASPSRSRTVEGGGPSVTTTLIVLAVVVGSILLTYYGKINGDAFVALASTIVGGVLVRAGVASGSKATVDPPPDG